MNFFFFFGIKKKKEVKNPNPQVSHLRRRITQILSLHFELQTPVRRWTASRLAPRVANCVAERQSRPWLNLHLCPLDRDLSPIELPLVSEQLLHGVEVFGLDRDRVAEQNAVVYAQANAGEEDPGDSRAYREASEQRVRRLARRDPSREPELRSVSHRPSLLGSSTLRGSSYQAAPSRGAESA